MKNRQRKWLLGDPLWCVRCVAFNEPHPGYQRKFRLCVRCKNTVLEKNPALAQKLEALDAPERRALIDDFIKAEKLAHAVKWSYEPTEAQTNELIATRRGKLGDTKDVTRLYRSPSASRT